MSGVLKRPPRIEPASPALLNDPLDFFFAEHFRQRQLMNGIDWLAGCEAPDRDLVAAVLAYLRHDLALHVQDEEQDLFPLLQRCCRAEDEVDAVIARLSAEHATLRRQAGRLSRGLEKALAEGRRPASYRGLVKAMRDFALGERRHLALENAVVLPLARLRFKDRDLAALRAGMTARRAAVHKTEEAEK